MSQYLVLEACLFVETDGTVTHHKKAGAVVTLEDSVAAELGAAVKRITADPGHVQDFNPEPAPEPEPVKASGRPRGKQRAEEPAAEPEAAPAETAAPVSPFGAADPEGVAGG